MGSARFASALRRGRTATRSGRSSCRSARCRFRSRSWRARSVMRTRMAERAGSRILRESARAGGTFYARARRPWGTGICGPRSIPGRQSRLGLIEEAVSLVEGQGGVGEKAGAVFVPGSGIGIGISSGLAGAITIESLGRQDMLRRRKSL